MMKQSRGLRVLSGMMAVLLGAIQPFSAYADVSALERAAEMEDRSLAAEDAREAMMGTSQEKRIARVERRLRRRTPLILRKFEKKVRKMSETEALEELARARASLPNEEFANELLDGRSAKETLVAFYRAYLPVILPTLAKDVVEAGGFLPYVRVLKAHAKGETPTGSVVFGSIVLSMGGALFLLAIFSPFLLGAASFVLGPVAGAVGVGIILLGMKVRGDRFPLERDSV